MSRCFPFPPPGYTLSSARKQIMIELIELHKEKQQKKEKKREKKERRKERRERSKGKKNKTRPNSNVSDVVKKGHIRQKVCSDYKDEFSAKRKEAKSEKLELSSLTEEHGRPGSLPIPSSSCDSTENTNNWKKRASPEDNSHGQSEAILIRLPSSRESDFLPQLKGDTGLRTGPEACSVQGINHRNNGKKICSTSVQIDAGKTIGSMSDDVSNPMQCVDLQYKDLLENWLPPQLQDTSLYAIDSDWLFHNRRNREKQDEKRRRCGSGGSISCCRSSGLWARAEYLPEVGVFALPYVLPY